MKKSFFMLSIGALALGLAFGYLNLQNTTTFAQDDTEAADEANAADAAEAPAEDAKAADAKKAPAEDAKAADAKEAPAEDAKAADAKEAPAEDAKAADAKEAPAEDAKAADAKEAPADGDKAADGAEAPAEEAKIDLDQQRADAQAILSKEGENAGDTATVTINNVKYTFHWCPAGSFMMGSPKEEQGHTYIERQHEVKLTKGFWMLETEVTQEMYRTVMPELKNPSYFADSGFGRDLLMNEKSEVQNTDKFPVDRISFDAAQQFCKVFSGLAGVYVHLPTEAQWEYACRAGTTTTYYCGDALKRAFANYHIEPKTDDKAKKDKNLHRTAEVGNYGKNQWGLCDMMGNLNEWCSDWYDPNYYMAGLKNAEGAPKQKASSDEEEEEVKEEDVVIPPVTDPQGPDNGQGHVLRGGCWHSQPFYCRSAARNYLIGNFHYGHYYDGFRFICIPNEEVPANEVVANEGEKKAEDAKPAEEKAAEANEGAEADKAAEDADANANEKESAEDAEADKAKEAVAEVEAAEDADASAKEAEAAEEEAEEAESPDDKAEEEAVKEDAAEDEEE